MREQRKHYLTCSQRNDTSPVASLAVALVQSGEAD
jgi:hypothetical protein